MELVNNSDKAVIPSTNSTTGSKIDPSKRKSIQIRKDSIKRLSVLAPALNENTIDYMTMLYFCLPFYNEFDAKYSRKEQITLLNKKVKANDTHFRIHPSSLFRISWDLLFWCK